MNLAERRIDSDSSKIGLSDTTGDADPAIVHGLIHAVHAADGNVSRIWSALCVGFIAVGLRICVTHDFRFVS